MLGGRERMDPRQLVPALACCMVWNAMYGVHHVFLPRDRYGLVHQTASLYLTPWVTLVAVWGAHWRVSWVF